MLSLWNKLWWGGDPDQQDDVTGLSRRDVHLVTRSWAVMNAQPDKYGMLIFIRLFRLNPDTQKLFKLLQNMTEDEITKSFQFRAHVVNLMSAVHSAVTHVHQPEVVVALMHKLGESHRQRKVRRIYFEELKAVLVDILQTDLRVSEATVAAWTRFVTFIYTHIFDKLQDN